MTRGSAAAVVGARLKAARKAALLTMDQAAGRTGISRPAIASYERGSRNVRVVVLLEMAAVYGVDARSLLPDAGATDPRREALAAVETVRTYLTTGGDL